MKLTRSWHVQSAKAVLCLLVCGSVLATGCIKIWTNKPPPVPVAGLTAIDEIAECIAPDVAGRSRSPAMEQWLGEIDRYTDAIDALRKD